MSEFRRRDCGFSAMAVGFGTGTFRFAGVHDGPRKITATRDGKLLASLVERARGNRLSFRLPDVARQPVRIDVTCLGVSE